MENASKALLIAAGILIAIILVTIGIKIFDSVNSKAIVEQVGQTMDAIQETANTKLAYEHNSYVENQISKYMGEGKTYAQFSELLDKITLINDQYENFDDIKIQWKNLKPSQLMPVKQIVDYIKVREGTAYEENTKFNIEIMRKEESEMIYAIYVQVLEKK